MYEPESDSEDELPPGWEERATLQGEVFYANHSEGSTQWTHPRTGRKKQVADQLPFGWERKILPDKKVIYVDHVNERTTYTDPRLAFAVEIKAEKADTFRQRFDGSSRALQVLHGQDLSGRVAVVTGANSGIGFQTARALALHGAHVVFACRSRDKAERAIKTILKERPSARCSQLELDLAAFSSIKQFAHRFQIQHHKLDYLVLNAGLFGLPFTTTQDHGIETMMQVNYLSSFHLLQLLVKPLLAAAAAASLAQSHVRVVIVCSESHRFAPVPTELLQPAHATNPGASGMDTGGRNLFAPPHAATAFSSMDAYNTSKLYGVLLAQAFHSRYQGLGVRCLAVHPGNMVAGTSLGSHWMLYRLLAMLVRPFVKSAEQAAASVIFALCSPDLQDVQGFTYINNCFPTRPSDVVEGCQAANILWDATNSFINQLNLG